MEFETLLIRQGLVRARLADVDDGEATEVIGLNGSRICSWRYLLEDVVNSSMICCFKASGSRCQTVLGDRRMRLGTPSTGPAIRARRPW